VSRISTIWKMLFEKYIKILNKSFLRNYRYNNTHVAYCIISRAYYNKARKLAYFTAYVRNMRSQTVIGKPIGRRERNAILQVLVLVKYFRRNEEFIRSIFMAGFIACLFMLLISRCTHSDNIITITKYLFHF